MAVSSFGLVPIVEDLFFRGYHVGALATRYSRAATIFISASVFALVHLQYLRLDLFAILNVASVFVTAAGLAWTVIATRSLLPAMVAHAYANTPRPLERAPYEI
ncbi:MAG: CPBP family intramembrane metalloprotease [Alphaproteobacteria bacterium]|nr:CPBP family intramembrane metalloprotease [Alphaproteobacteria bacterium]